MGKKGYLNQGDPSLKNHDDHSHSSPHPTHGSKDRQMKAAPKKVAPKVKQLEPDADDTAPASAQ